MNFNNLFNDIGNAFLNNNQNNNNPNNNTTYNYSNNNYEYSNSFSKQEVINKYKKKVIDRIEKLYKNNKFESVIHEIKELLKVHKTDLKLLLLLMKSYYFNKEFDKSFQVINEIEKFNNELFEVNDLKAKLFFEKFKNEENINILEDIINIYNNSLSINLNNNEKYNATYNIFLIRKIKYLKDLEKKEMKKVNLYDYFNKECKNKNIDFNRYKHYFNNRQNLKNNEMPGLTCNMTLELMCEPICLESGYSYEDKMIREYFTKNTENNLEIKDPCTNKEIKNKNIYKNIYLKRAIKNFIQKNPYSWDSYGENDWRKIELI